MAISVDWTTLTFIVPQGDLTLVSGTLYEMDTENYFRQQVNAIMASEEGIVFEDPLNHFTETVIAGVTYARLIEMINGYSVRFSPDSQWSVIYNGSNNNLFDVEAGILEQNQVQVIPQNSAGLIRESGNPRKGVAYSFSIAMAQALDHVSPLIGATVSGFVSQDGSTPPVALATAITEIGLGLYRVSLTAAEMDFNEVACAFTAPDGDTRFVIIETAR